MSEVEVLCADARFVLTRRLATIDGVSYPIDGLTSIRVQTMDRSHPLATGCFHIFGTVVGLIGAVALTGALFTQGAKPEGVVATAVVCIAVGVGLWHFANTLKRAPEYALILRTSAGEHPVMIAADRDYIDGVREWIEYAVQIG